MMVENNSTNRRILKLYTKRVLNKFYKCYIFFWKEDKYGSN